MPRSIDRFVGPAGRARLALAALVALAVLGSMPQSRGPKAELPPPGRGDTVLFESTIERLRAGEPYYDAIGVEMRQRNYPTASVFNWRTPAHLLFVSSVSARNGANDPADARDRHARHAAVCLATTARSW